MGIRILLVEDQEVMREGLHAVLFRQADFEIVGCAKSGEEALERVKTNIPEVVIMDARMPDMSGFETTEKLLKDFPQLKVIFLSIHRNRACVVAAIKAGASGYVLKDSGIEELVGAVRKVYHGKTYISSQIAHLKEEVQLE
ncbi:MAG: response regulator [Verrucomicrobiota bacterium]